MTRSSWSLVLLVVCGHDPSRRACPSAGPGGTRSSPSPWRPGTAWSIPRRGGPPGPGRLRAAGRTPSSSSAFRRYAEHAIPPAGSPGRPRRHALRHESAALLPAAERLDPGRRYRRRTRCGSSRCSGLRSRCRSSGGSAATWATARPSDGRRSCSTPGPRSACSIPSKAGCTRWCGASRPRWPGSRSGSARGGTRDPPAWQPGSSSRLPGLYSHYFFAFVVLACGAVAALWPGRLSRLAALGLGVIAVIAVAPGTQGAGLARPLADHRCMAQRAAPLARARHPALRAGVEPARGRQLLGRLLGGGRDTRRSL